MVPFPTGRPLVAAGRLARLLEGRVSEELARLHGLPPTVEALNITRPKIVTAIHERFLDAGADVILTNSSGAVPQLLDRDRIDHEAFPITYMGATLAADAVAGASRRGSEAYAIGDVVIPWRQPFAGFARPTAIEKAAHLLVSAQAAGGVDAVLLDLPHDAAPMTAAIAGARSGMAEAGRSIPILVSLRFEAAPSLVHSGSIVDALARAASTVSGHGVRLVRFDEAAPAASGALRLHLASEPRRATRLRRLIDADDGSDAVDGPGFTAVNANSRAGTSTHSSQPSLLSWTLGR